MLGQAIRQAVGDKAGMKLSLIHILISYGMGEKSIVEIADALASGMDVSDITYVRGTVFKARNKNSFYDEIYLPAYEEMKADKKLYAQSFKIQYDNTDPFTGKMLVEAYPHEVYVVQNPPAMPLTQEEMDDIYALPYTCLLYTSRCV